MVVVEACVDPDLRRDDVERGQAGRHTNNVIPTQVGIHARVQAYDASAFRNKPAAGAGTVAAVNHT